MHNRAGVYHKPKTVAPETTDTPVIAPLLPGKTGDLLPFLLSSSRQGTRPECKGATEAAARQGVGQETYAVQQAFALRMDRG